MKTAELDRLREGALSSLRRRIAVLAVLVCAWELHMHEFYGSINIESSGVDAVLRSLGSWPAAAVACATLALAVLAVERGWLARQRFDVVRRVGRGLDLLAFGTVMRALVPVRQMVNDAGFADMRDESNVLMILGLVAVVRELVRARRNADPA